MFREFHYTITGETACKKNENKFTRRGICFKTKRFRLWHEDAARQILSQGVPDTPIEHATAVFKFYHGNLVNRDSDNQMTSLLDLFQDVGVLLNDSWKNLPRKVVEDYYEKGNPHVEIFIKEIDNFIP